jgi:hypothetical protein
MTRRVLLYEGVETVDHRTIESGALTWEDPIPITAALGPGQSVVMGYVTEIRRESNGAVTGDIRLVMPDALFAEADLDDVEHPNPEGDEPFVVTKGRLRAITLGVNPAWEPETMGRVEE